MADNFNVTALKFGFSSFPILAEIDFDPRTLGGFVANVGSLLSRTDVVPAELWIKVDAANVDWVDITAAARLDVAQQFTKNQRSDVFALTDGATVDYLATDSNIYELVATNIGTRVLNNPTGLAKGMTWQVWFVQDPVNGLEGMTFDTFYDWGDDVAPDFTAQSVNIVNIITCVAVSTTKIRAFTSFGA